MSIPYIKTVINGLRESFDLSLTKVKGKQIIFEGYWKDGKSVVLISPLSKLYESGNGWVDITKKQVELLNNYSIAIAAFRLPDMIYYFDFNQLNTILSDDCLIYNEREGEHWKMDIWPNEIRVKNGGGSIQVTANNINILNDLFIE